MLLLPILAAIAVNAPNAVREHEIVVFQKDLPASRKDGRAEYDRFIEDDLFDAEGRPRTVGLIGCGSGCQYRTIRMAPSDDVNWTFGEHVPEIAGSTDDHADRPVRYAFSGQKGRVQTLPDGGYRVTIDEYASSHGRVRRKTPPSARNVVEFGDGGDRSWSYGPSIDERGRPIMRLVVAWENAMTSPSRPDGGKVDLR